MTDVVRGPIDGAGGVGGMSDDAQSTGIRGGASGGGVGRGIDADFGELEMFDSNNPPGPISFDANSSSPVQKKSKKKKKKKKKSKKEKESRHHDESATQAKATGGEDADVPADVQDEKSAAKKSKRKRRSSDAAEHKRRKKRKARDAAAKENSNEATDDHAVEFLHSDDGPRTTATAPVADMGDGGATDPDSQQPPAVVHARRLSATQEEDGQQLRMQQRDHEAISDMDVENLAREAWNEHMNGNGAQPADSQQVESQEAANVEMQNADQHQANAEGTVAAAANETPKSKRSSRKKAKPSYYENEQNTIDDDYDSSELPSASAMTSKPRKRAKTSSKKGGKARGPRLSQSMRGDTDAAADDDDDDPDAPRGRRNRMAGFTKGRFTDEELERISKQVTAFARENELSQHDVNEMIQAAGGTSAGEAHAQLWSRLFAECPDRHRQKVINITRKKFHNFVARGTWTPEQDMELRQLIDVHGTAWSKIAALINRHPEDLRDRYRNYIVCGDSQRKDTWDEKEEGRLAQYVIEAMASIDELRSVQPSRKLLQKPYEELIDWQSISERMDRTRSRLQCITKWKSMNLKMHGKDKLVSQQPNAEISFNLDKARRQIDDMPVAERYRLLLAIRAAEPTSEAKIPWHKLNDKEYRTQWHRATLMVLWHRLRRTVPGWDRKTVCDCAKYLIDQYDRADELPDVGGDNYDNAEEMRCIESLSTSSSGRKQKNRWGLSQDYVQNSDEEGDSSMQQGQDQDHEQGQEHEEGQDQGLQIDPALMGESGEQPAVEEQEEEAEAEAEAAQGAEAAQEPSWAKGPGVRKTPSKQATYGKKKKGSSGRRSAMLSQDPIEDDENDEAGGQAGAAAEAGQDSEVEESRPRKKKASKYQISGGGGRGKKREEEARAEAELSDMDDMSDLPATRAV